MYAQQALHPCYAARALPLIQFNLFLLLFVVFIISTSVFYYLLFLLVIELFFIILSCCYGALHTAAYVPEKIFL